MNGNVYSFLDVQAAIVGPGGTFSLGSGAGAAEEGIEITPAGDINTMQIGADGTGQHSLHGDKSGTVTVRLLKTSQVNGQLSLLYAFQTSNSGAHGQNTITLTDRRGDVITCRQCAFKRAPALTYSKDAGMNEWVFDVVFIDRVLASGTPV